MSSFRGRILTAIILGVGVGCRADAEWRTVSPDGTVALAVTLRDGTPRYTVTHRDRPVVLDSRLGFELAGGVALLDGFEFLGAEEREYSGRWRPVYGEHAEIVERFRERRLELRHRVSGLRVNLLVRAYPEGAALRYEFPAEAGRPPVVIVAERTEFLFPDGTFGYEEHGTEGEYRRARIESIQPKCERPLTLEFADGRFACLVEAGLDRYPRMLLSPSPFSQGALISDLSGPATFDPRQDCATPWRAFIVADRPGDLLERNILVQNLSLPCKIADTAWIVPGKVIREVSLSTPGGKACVDFAVAHGFRYVLYDAGWYGYEKDVNADARAVNLDPKRVGHVPDHPGLDLAEVIAYGKRQGIGILVYVNRLALERQIDELLPLYASWGVAGVKFGFVQVGPQEWTTWVHDAVRKAAAHRLVVNIHDSYRPSGFSRTYPNLLTQEGVRGNEQMPTATHNATLPFARLPAGAADYTICIHDRRIKPTRAHQLALAVTGYSPLQHLYWYDRPAQFDDGPELAFLDAVPTVWDETRVIDGAIGEFVTIARRSGNQWFVGSITGDQDGGRKLAIPLTFLPDGAKFVAHIYENDPANPRATRLSTQAVDRRTILRPELSAAGGQSIRIAPAPAN
jgi:alpha-glucosidase